MAFPSIGSAVDTDFATSVTSMAVNLPASISSGDLLIGWCSVRNAGTWTMATGWTNLSEQAGGGTVGETLYVYRIADGTEGATATFTAGTATTGAWQMRKVTGWHGSSAPEIASTNGDASAANPPSLTPSWGSADTLWVAVAGHAAISTTPFSAGPSGYSDYAQNGASSGGAAVAVASAYINSAAASEDPGAFTVGSSNRFWTAATIAIRPTAGGDTYILVPADMSLSLTSDNTTINQNHVLATQDATLALTADNTTITQNHDLSPQDATLSLTADTTIINQNHVLTPQDASLSLTADSTTITQVHIIDPQDATLSLTADATTITQNHVLSPQDASLSLTSDNTTVAEESVTLSPDDMSLTLTADPTTITQIHVIVADDLLLNLTADNTTLSQNHILVPQDATLTLSEDGTTITQNHDLTPADLALGLTADATTITQNHVIVPTDLFLSLSVDITAITTDQINIRRRNVYKYNPFTDELDIAAQTQAVRELTGDDTITNQDDVILMNGTSGTVTATLPDVANQDLPLVFVATNDTNTLTITTTSSQQIRRVGSDTLTSITLTEGDILKLIPAGDYWQMGS